MTLIIAEPSKIRLMNVIGSGTFGVVYRATWRGSIVAAKVLNIPSTAREDAILKEIQTIK